MPLPALQVRPNSPHLSPSTVISNPHLLTIIQNRTNRTLRQPPGANVLAERHQQSVDLHPVLPWQPLLEKPACRLRRIRVHEPPSVGDAVDVDIDADLGSPTRDP